MEKKSQILEKLIEAESSAQKYGFDWPHSKMIVDHAISECEEIKKAIETGNENHIQSEIGDLMHVAISLCIFLGYDVYDTLENSTEKFKKRMKVVKEIAAEEGLDSLHGQSIEFLLSMWNKAKEKERSRAG